MGRGGQNQTHQTVERAKRIDSFVVGKLSGPHVLSWGDGNSIGVTAAGGNVELAYRFNEREVRELMKVSRVSDHYGGDRPFLICPGCGRRVRFLYLSLGRFRCRSCARLNYRSQQATKDEFYHYRAAVKMLRERFKVPEDQIPVPIDLPRFFPDKPKWMRWATYWKLLELYGALRRQYEAAFVSEALEFFRADGVSGW